MHSDRQDEFLRAVRPSGRMRDGAAILWPLTPHLLLSCVDAQHHLRIVCHSPPCHVILTPPPPRRYLRPKMSFVMSIFVLGYKMTLLEKQARLQIRKWTLEARMDTDTMLNKKAARGRRYSWACQQCEVGQAILRGSVRELNNHFAV